MNDNMATVTIPLVSYNLLLHDSMAYRMIVAQLLDKEFGSNLSDFSTLPLNDFSDMELINAYAILMAGKVECGQ